MQVIGLDNKKYNWTPSSQPRNNASEYHIKARETIKKLFPFSKVLEEVHAIGTKLYLDFYLPKEGIVIEVHGEQHYSFNSLFFRDQKHFLEVKHNDKRKQDWCYINDIEYVELPYDDQKNWEDRIVNRADYTDDY